MALVDIVRELSEKIRDAYSKGNTARVIELYKEHGKELRSRLGAGPDTSVPSSAVVEYREIGGQVVPYRADLGQPIKQSKKSSNSNNENKNNVSFSTSEIKNPDFMKNYYDKAISLVQEKIKKDPGFRDQLSASGDFQFSYSQAVLVTAVGLYKGVSNDVIFDPKEMGRGYLSDSKISEILTKEKEKRSVNEKTIDSKKTIENPVKTPSYELNGQMSSIYEPIATSTSGGYIYRNVITGEIVRDGVKNENKTQLTNFFYNNENRIEDQRKEGILDIAGSYVKGTIDYFTKDLNELDVTPQEKNLFNVGKQYGPAGETAARVVNFLLVGPMATGASLAKEGISKGDPIRAGAGAGLFILSASPLGGALKAARSSTSIKQAIKSPISKKIDESITISGGDDIFYGKYISIEKSGAVLTKKGDIIEYNVQKIATQKSIGSPLKEEGSLLLKIKEQGPAGVISKEINIKPVSAAPQIIPPAPTGSVYRIVDSNKVTPVLKENPIKKESGVIIQQNTKGIIKTQDGYEVISSKTPPMFYSENVKGVIGKSGSLFWNSDDASINVVLSKNNYIVSSSARLVRPELKISIDPIGSVLGTALASADDLLIKQMGAIPIQKIRQKIGSKYLEKAKSIKNVKDIEKTSIAFKPILRKASSSMVKNTNEIAVIEKIASLEKNVLNKKDIQEKTIGLIAPTIYKTKNIAKSKEIQEKTIIAPTTYKIRSNNQRSTGDILMNIKTPLMNIKTPTISPDLKIPKFREKNIIDISRKRRVMQGSFSGLEFRI